MDEITLDFTPYPLNVSVQIGDTAYYSNDVNGTEIIEIGIITAISTYTITAQIAATTPRPTANSSFILFSKTANVNTNGIKGYYAELQMKNNSDKYAELFLVGAEIVESSK